MVSVIIPVYNVEAYLERCLKSVVEQTFHNIEILVINDGSTDASLSVCRDWEKKDDRIRVFDKSNEGLGPTRNLGIEKAQGEYILFVDSDDWIAKECVEVLWKHAIKNQSDVVIFDYFWVTVNDNGIKADQSARRYIELPEGTVTLRECPQMLSRVTGTVWNKFQRTAFLREHNLRQPAHAYEDAGYTYRLLALAGRISQVRKELYYYWINRKDSIMNIAPHIEECKLTLREMQEALYDTGHFDICYQYIEKFSSVLLQTCFKRVSRENANLIIEGKEFYYKMYPKAKGIDQLKFLLIGSENVRQVFERMRLMELEPEQYIADYNPLCAQANCVWEKKSRECEYVLFDLCGHIEYDFLQSEQWNTVLGTFVANLAKQNNIKKIFIMDSRLAIGAGGYSAANRYEDMEMRIQYNRSLEQMMLLLRHLLPDAVYLSPPEEKYLFADEDRGLPLNHYWYYDKADEMRKRLLDE